MSRDLPAALRDQKEKQNSFAEVVNAERLLWASIQSEGILHPNIQDLYHKARTAYENIILNNNEVELQEVEYSLWKLHYKHIDEFRKRIKKAYTNAESNNINSHLEGFKLFLSEATEFYNDLISKFRKCCGLPEDSFLYKKGQRCNYASHRFLVCLGDLSRYKELCKKPDAQKWAVAATYYLEATMVWPDSGNPQNQLALLATYVGDDFLALYHCVRSLAVKEPFPDARDNIMLLFEKNRSSQLHSLSSKSDFDFSKPFKRSSLLTKSHSSCDSTNSDKLEAVECGPYGKTESWHLFVRMISFFLVKSSLEDFPHTFASTMSEFEALLALDDTKLNSTLELYDQMDSARKGPYRALQVVSIIIFIIHNLAESPEPTDPKEKQLSAWTQWGWTCTFTFLGRFLERCVGNNHPECSPLLPAVLVFVEWFVGVLDYTEAADEKVSTARSYFFGAFVDLLNQLDFLEDEVKSVDQIALWEDYELRGFGPIAHSHQSLDFSTHWSKYEGGNKRRTHRIFLAAMKIVNRSNGSQKWIFYDQLARKFHASDSTNEKDIPGMNGAMEEEEEIVFKPLMRYNSAPIHTCVTTSDQISLQGISNQKTGTSDESLRRAASLFVEQNEDLINLHTDTSNFRYKQRDPLQTGPPSLSGWVLNKESSNIEREKGTRNLSKPELIPIQEIPYMPLANLSISPCLAPIPSAPLLPEDPIWLRGNFPESKTSPALGMIKEGHSILSALPLSRFSNFSPPRERVIPSFIDAFPQPPVLGMSSSEWLYHYNLERGNISNHSPGNLGNYLHGYDGSSRFDVFDRWGNPLATNRTVYLEKPNLHMGSPLVYGCGVGANAEQPQHLQYLKEREWQLQSEPPLRGPTYMGN